METVNKGIEKAKADLEHYERLQAAIQLMQGEGLDVVPAKRRRVDDGDGDAPEAAPVASSSSRSTESHRDPLLISIVKFLTAHATLVIPTSARTVNLAHDKNLCRKVASFIKRNLDIASADSSSINWHYLVGEANWTSCSTDGIGLVRLWASKECDNAKCGLCQASAHHRKTFTKRQICE